MIFHHAVARTAQTALIHGNHKLVKTWKEDRLELFDLSKSVSEEEDLSEQLPQKTAELHSMMVDCLAAANAETRKTGSKKGNKKSRINKLAK